MFVQISPSNNDVGETVSSLNFGVELGSAKRQIDIVEQQKMKQMLDKLRQESRTKDESLKELEENCQHLENKLKEKEQHCRMLQEKNKDLASQVNSNAETQSQLDRKQCQFMEKLNRKEEESMMLKQKVKELEFKLNEQAHSENAAKTNVHIKQVKELETPSILLSQSANRSRIGTASDESTSYTHILGSSTSINRPKTVQVSALYKGASPYGIKRKEERKRQRNVSADDHENHGVFSKNLEEKKTEPKEINRTRKLDQEKAYGKVVTTRKLFPHSRIEKEQQAKVRRWVR